MRTVWVVVDRHGDEVVCDDETEARRQAPVWDRSHPHDAPHSVVERQVAGPEDTDELLRLRALVDDLRLHVCPLPAVDYLLRSRGFDGPVDGPFGGES